MTKSWVFVRFRDPVEYQFRMHLVANNNTLVESLELIGECPDVM